MPIIKQEPKLESIEFISEPQEIAGGVEGRLYMNDGGERCSGQAGLEIYTGGAFYDISDFSCGVQSTLTMTSAGGDFTMAAGTYSRWVKNGQNLTIHAFLQWTSKGTASGAVYIDNFLPFVSSATPTVQTLHLGSYTGIALASSDLSPKGTVFANASIMTFSVCDSNTGAAIALMTASQFGGSGIIYVGGDMII